jgi:hypothetical protein
MGKFLMLNFVLINYFTLSLLFINPKKLNIQKY